MIDSVTSTSKVRRKPALRVLAVVLVAVALLGLGACSFSSEKSSIVESDLAFQDPGQKKAPLDIEVGQVFLFEGDLHLEAKVLAVGPFEPERVAVLAKGLSDGDVVEEQAVRLSDYLEGEKLNPGETFSIPFTLDAENLTEYQLQLVWGDEAEPVLSNLAMNSLTEDVATEQAFKQLALAESATQSQEETEAKAPNPEMQKKVDTGRQVTFLPAKGSDRSPGLEVKVSQVDRALISCEKAPCDYELKINAELINNSSNELKSISLALGLFWVERHSELPTAKSGAPLGDNEQEIQLTGVKLEAGDSRKIRVRFDRPVPSVPGGSFVPRLRVLNFDS